VVLRDKTANLDAIFRPAIDPRGALCFGEETPSRIK